MATDAPSPREGLPEDGWHKFDIVKAMLAERGYTLLAPGEHDLPTRFAARFKDEPLHNRSGLDGLIEAVELCGSYDALNSPRHQRWKF